MDKARFEELVARAVEELPEEFRAAMDNIDVVVEDVASPEQAGKAGLKHGQVLLGLYEGIPQTKRSSTYGMVLPDKISIFQKPIEAKCSTEGDIILQVQRVVRHEIAHHFGIGDARLQEIEREKS